MRSKTRIVYLLAAAFILHSGPGNAENIKPSGIAQPKSEAHRVYTNFNGDLTIEEIAPIHHQIRLRGKVIFDDTTGREKTFNRGLQYESEFGFADRIHYLVSQHSSDSNCPKEYRIITVKDHNDFSISDAFGKCHETPAGDKYDDGSMDLLFPEKDPEQLKLFYTSDGKIQKPPGKDRFVFDANNIAAWREDTIGITIKLTNDGAKKLLDTTSKNLRKKIDLYIDDELLASPVFYEPLSGGSLFLDLAQDHRQKLIPLLPPEKEDKTLGYPHPQKPH